MLVLGLACDDVTLCQAVAHCIETRHPDVVMATTVTSWLHELQSVVGSSPEMAIVLNIHDNTDANTLRRSGGLIVHLTRSSRVETLDVVEGDYLLACRDGGDCYDRIRDTLNDIQREVGQCA